MSTTVFMKCGDKTILGGLELHLVTLFGSTMHLAFIVFGWLITGR